MLLFLENNKDHNKYLTVNMDIHVRIMVQKIKFCLEMEIRYTPICWNFGIMKLNSTQPVQLMRRLKFPEIFGLKVKKFSIFT